MIDTREQLQSLLALVPDACVLVDVEGRIVYANEWANGLFGYRAGELTGAPVELLIPERLRKADTYYRSRFKIKPERRQAGDGPRIHGLHKDGHEIPVHIGISPVGTGADLLTICTVRDLTQRAELEDQLREAVGQLERRARMSEDETRRANEQFMLFLKHAPAAIAMLDRNMRYLIVSDRWLSDFGLQKRDVHGLNHYEVFPDSSEKWKDVHRRCLAGDVQQSDEDSVVGADGKVQWLFWEVHPWKWPDGRVGGVLWFSEVITRRKMAEAELLKSHQELEKRVADRTAELQAMKDAADRANAQKTWFVAAASHDLRQPLQASLAYLSVLLPKMQEADLQDLCEKARQPLKAMSDILDVLLDISDLESGRIAPRNEDFPLNALLHRVVANAQHHALEKGLRLSCVPTDLWVRTDPKLLERVLSNFVANAVRYTDKGLIGVSCERIGGTICISVTDTGIGIPADALETIFEDHVQLGNPARDRRKGLGLGLSIAKRIADSLGHRIWVTSEVGAGSSFSIELPEAGTGSAEPVAELSSAPRSRTDKVRPVVLLIDDDPDVGEAMQMLLQSYGFETYVATGRDGALAMLEAGLVPGLVLCDYRLPGVNGIDVIRQVRRTMNSHAPAVLMTGDLALQECPADLDKCALLHKPVDVDRFLAVIEELGA